MAMSILNIVDGHYVNDLKISIDAITVEMLANELFTISLDAGVVLTDIETKKNNAMIAFITNNNALTHLVTGRDFNGGTLGVAYLGSVCEANGFSTGTSSIFYEGASPNIALTALVVAHELAHNLGSDHDGPGANEVCPSATYIMSPIIDPSFMLTNFSSCSADGIEATLSALATPELCMDFPADVSIVEQAGNNGVLNASLEFSSAYTGTRVNGFKSVDRVNLSGTINDVEGIFVTVIANGVNYSIAAGGGSYSYTVNNPPLSFPVLATVKVNAMTTRVDINQNVSEDTADVQEVNASNNSLTSTCSISGNDSECTPSVAAPTNPVNPVAPVANEEESGGAGSLDLLFILTMLGMYGYQRRQEAHL